MSKSWFKITNAAAEEAEVSIYDVIGLWGISARSFIQQLKAITAKKINLRIHSPGGDVFEGNAIFNALKRHPAKITTYIDGLAASMASVVALAGETVHIAGNGMVMIHDPSTYGDGTADDMRKKAELLDKVKETLLNTYEEKTGLDRDEIARMMKKETWMTAEEALEHGFVDVVDAELKAAALTDFDLSRFGNAPRFDSRASADMKILTVSIAAMLATATGAALTEASTEAEVKAALDALAGKISALEADKKKLTDDLAAEQGKVSAIEKEKTDISAKLVTAEGEVTKLKGEAKTADQKAAEIAASHGSLPAKKDGENAANNGGGTDGKALYDQYAKLNGREAAEFWNTNSKALIAYGESLERKRRENAD